MKEEYKRIFRRSSIVLLLILQLTIFFVIWENSYNELDVIASTRIAEVAIICIYMLWMILVTKVFGGYNVGYLKITELFILQTVSMVCVNIIEYLELCMIAHQYVSIEPMVIVTLCDIVIALPWSYLTRFIYVRLYPAKNMIFIYGNHPQNELVNKINEHDDKYNILAAISVNEGIQKIYDNIGKYDAVIIGDIPVRIRNDILKYCYSVSKRVYITPKLSDIIIRQAKEIHLFDTPLYMTRCMGLLPEQQAVKRVMDIVISLIMLVILGIPMILTAIIIKIQDGGPVFYRQERLTKDRRPFTIIKFRSMIIDSEKYGARLASKDDARITPFGKFIRRIHFDEVPQLFNILRGDMSFVGPRPERDCIAKQYEEKLPEYAFRLKVKAGLTGYAQVYGKYNTTPYDKLKLDLTYIEKYSLGLDVKIIFMTIKAIFQADNTEGVDECQTTALPSDNKNEIKRH